MPDYTDTVWTVTGTEIPVRIYRERRSSNRISFGRKRVIIRLPRYTGNMEPSLKWARQWIRHRLEEYPELRKRYQARSYFSGMPVHTTRRDYTLRLKSQERKTNTAKLIDQVMIELKLDHSLATNERSHAIQSLISRTIARDQLPLVRYRINELNDLHFGKRLNSIKIKNNSSNWGSCSSSGNINISSRTLLAPLDVQDYVFIHELAHLEELNHSQRYWSLVKTIMPDYGEKEQWLKKHGRQLSF